MKNGEGLLTWESINAMLPHDLDALAKRTGAVKRWRKVTNGRQLLWMCLMYAQAFMSLRAIAGLSVGFGGVTDGAVKHRLQNAAPFLGAVLAHQINAMVASAGGSGLRRAVRLIDSTSLSVPGSKGTDWRIHVCYDPGHGLSRIDVTDASGAESAARGEYGYTDVSVGDQGYCRANDLHYLDSRGVYALMRAYLRNIKLLDAAGTRLDIVQVLDRADRGDCSTIVYVPTRNNQRLEARLIVRALAPKAAEAARKKLRRTASKKCSKVTPQAERLAGYFVVLTTVPAECLSDDEVITLYLLRWQVELLFKRWKSILRLDKLEADDPALVRAFCLSKLIEAAMLERLAGQDLANYARTTVGLDPGRPSCTPWRLTALYHASFQNAVLEAFPVSRQHMLRVIDVMREGKRRRRNAFEKAAPVLRRLALYAPSKQAA